MPVISIDFPDEVLEQLERVTKDSRADSKGETIAEALTMWEILVSRANRKQDEGKQPIILFTDRDLVTRFDLDALPGTARIRFPRRFE